MYFCQLYPLRIEFCVSNCFFVCTECTVVFSLIYFWKYLVSWGREVFFRCVDLSPPQIFSSHMCRGYHPGLNFVLAFECVKCSGINKTAVSESTGHQCLVLKWKLAVWQEMYFMLFHSVEASELAGLLCASLQSCLLAFAWMNWWRKAGDYMVFHILWSECNSRCHSVQRLCAVSFLMPYVSNSPHIWIIDRWSLPVSLKEN